jgi:DNA-binding response OmpR family regulator
MFSRKSVDDKMRALQSSYLSTLPAKLGELAAAVRPLLEGGSDDEMLAALTDLRDLSHKLAGSAGTFGHGEISEAAHGLEELAEFVLGAGQQPTAEQIADIRTLLGRLAAAAPGESGDPAAPSAGRAAKEGPIFVLAQSDFGAPLRRRLTDQGRAVRHFTSAEEIDDEALDLLPRAIVVHGAFPRGAEVCRSIAETVRQESGADIPIVFVSNSGDFATRLRAVRAGAKDYLVEPLDAAEVVRAVDRPAAGDAFRPYRILIVEDDGNLAVQCAKAFEGPGYLTRIVEDPATLFDTFRTFDPELIVMDVSLKVCSGLDIARVIWQREDRTNTSIVFVTSGPEFNREILKLGAPDEFFVPRPLDTLALCALVARHLFKVRAGWEPPNRAQLLQCLDRAAGLGRGGAATEKKAGAARRGRAQPPEEPRSAPKVLVVDDDEHIVNGIAIKLSAHGIGVLKAFSGEQAFEVAWREHPDLIISDYGMPRGSGEYLLTRLKSTAETKKIPVVILTGRRVGHNKDYALERDLCGRLGAVSYLSKPIKFDDVVRELRQFIRFPTGAVESRPPGRAARR